MNMRKLLLFVLMLSALTTATTSTPLENETVILITEGGSSDGERDHRSSAMIPIEASYSSSLSVISLIFLADLGQVTIDIDNLTTTQSFQTVINAAQGKQTIMMTDSAGSYLITLMIQQI